ncbi:BMP family ABC transporter substrate-binding protein [Sinirhodobacter huangdaonensis]|uniref:BMP family ABC transporter substrate-binding protein n=1 Tax=Paenirhodobacter huangdaonensis TaxID=2501515 RepID=A0A443LEN5_9RHOB|nr:BMP family ABC transporter substrate-binding protein [Sinirhodobacter huangdaonensis]RWR47565.1 BMP family ABC transporter substrate-binding protein [Sinirhodobacter huangdaonensis]
MPATVLSRRGLLGTGAAALAASVLPVRLARAETPVVIGAIYVGPRDDYGWSQSHAAAMDILRQVPGVTVVEEENVPETNAVGQTMESMINLEGANLILATSFGYYNPFVIDAARKYPAVQFRHCAPLWNPETDPKNAGSYFSYLNQAHYVNGVAAGLSSPTGKLGFVAAKPVQTVLSNVNSFLLGARSVNPAATAQVIFTGEWSMPVREAEATNALIDAGCDVVGCHVDSPKVVIETAEVRGVKTCGHNANCAPLAPKGFITGAESKWETVYKTYAAAIAAGEAPPNLISGGYNNDMLRNTAYGAGATPAAQAAADAAIAALKEGKPIYVGPLKDNTGKLVIEGTLDNYAPELEKMDYLLDGVIGSTT